MTTTTGNESAMSTITTMSTPATPNNDSTTQLPTSSPNLKDVSESPLEMGKMTIMVNKLSLNAKNEASKSNADTQENSEQSTKGSPEANGNGITSTDQNGNSVTETPEPSSISPSQNSPTIVVSPHEAYDHQLPTGLPVHPVDHPDPRLIDALENPRDRLFVVKLEKDIIEFINEKDVEAFDLPPTNSYHRLLTHKMAEYYRLTHVADSACAAVKIFRGQAARIPPTKLCDWPVPSLQLQAKPNAGTSKPLVKIMRRATPSEKGGLDGKGTSTPRKDGSEASSDHGDSSTTSNPAKTSREEREAAYEKARARIFKDFVESPPETPPPMKHDRPRRRDDDDFSSRSQFVAMNPAIPPPQMYFPQQYPPSAMMVGQHTPQNQMRFNPMSTNFNPSASTFSPGPMGYGPSPQQQRQFTPSAYPTDRGYPQPQQQSPQPLYPPQQRGYFPQQPPPIQNGTFTPPRPTMMQQSYSSSGYGSTHSSPQPPIPQHPSMSAPPQQMNRQMPQPYNQLPHQYPPHHQQQPQQRNPASFGWGSPGPIGGVSMHPRSSSAPGHPGMPDAMGGYGVGVPQQPIWNQGSAAWNSPGAAAAAAAASRSPNHGMGMGMNMGNGMGNGMNMRM